MNEKKNLKSIYNIEEIFIDFDYKNKKCKKTSALMSIFDYMNVKDLIFFRNTNKFFNNKLEMNFLKKNFKKKLLSKKEQSFIIKKIIISPE